MSSLTFKETLLIAEVLEIKNGYVFDNLRKIIEFSKRDTRNIIYGACGIDIFEHENYSSLSQQKCLERIWEKENDTIAFHVLSDFMEYYYKHYPSAYLSTTMKHRYNECTEILRRLEKSQSVELPQINTEQLNVLKKDIEDSFSSDVPELCIDRLHTFATEYIRGICQKHGIAVNDGNGNNHPLHSILGALAKYYRDHDRITSEFCVVAVRNSIDMFTKYNDLRNTRSYAHPNSVLRKSEAKYAVQAMTNTLLLIEAIEAELDENI